MSIASIPLPRREFAILATIGTSNRDMLVGTVVEGAASVVGASWSASGSD
jgi:hypothetical protein